MVYGWYTELRVDFAPEGRFYDWFEGGFTSALQITSGFIPNYVWFALELRLVLRITSAFHPDYDWLG